MGDFLLAVISFLVVLGPLILIHEFGHFIAARLIGVTVLEFGLGFPPRALKLFEQGGTEFTLNWLPIGGFVRPLGEDFVKPVGEQATEQERAAIEKQQSELEKLGKKRIKTKSLMEAGPWQRMFFMVAGAALNFLGAFVILTIAAMLGRPAPAVVVLGSSPRSPAHTAQIFPGDIVLDINGAEVRRSEQAKTILEGSVEKPITITLKREDKTLQYTLNPTESRTPAQGVLVTDVAPGSPASEFLESGDIILRADTRNVSTVEGLKMYVDEHAGQTVTLVYERNGVQNTHTIIPRTSPPAGEGAMGVSIVQLTYDPTFGLAFGDATAGKIEKASLGEAIGIGANQTIDMMGRVVNAPIQIIKGQLSASEARPVSPVGIAQMSSQVILQSRRIGELYPILNFIAVISIALGITNLLPIPGLDGGRILFVIIELLRGKPMDPEREGLVHLIGLMLLLAFVAIFVVNDILNPIVLPGLPR
jgi:regulator of sigma E protease